MNTTTLSVTEEIKASLMEEARRTHKTRIDVLYQEYYPELTARNEDYFETSHYENFVEQQLDSIVEEQYKDWIREQQD